MQWYCSISYGFWDNSKFIFTIKPDNQKTANQKITTCKICNFNEKTCEGPKFAPFRSLTLTGSEITANLYKPIRKQQIENFKIYNFAKKNANQKFQNL